MRTSIHGKISCTRDACMHCPPSLCQNPVPVPEAYASFLCKPNAFSLPAPDSLSYLSILLQDLNSAPVTVHIRDCQSGEVRGINKDVCDRCPSGQYSFDALNPTCDSPCPANADCLGGRVMTPKLGSWHSNATSTLMHSCPNQDACRYASYLLQPQLALLLKHGTGERLREYKHRPYVLQHLCMHDPHCTGLKSLLSLMSM